VRAARLARDIFRAEGLRGFVERLADRSAALRARLEERAVSPERLARDAGPVPVLDVLATPLAPRFGGVPTLFGARLVEEVRLRPTALLSPEGGWWTLRTTRNGEALRTRLGPVEKDADPARGLRAGVEAILRAARLVGATVVNVEGVAGWPPEALKGLAGGERKLVLSLLDFALFCPRPNLVEEPHGRFCGYSRDAERCRACLGVTWSRPSGFVEAWRKDAEELLSAADAVVYLSEFLRRRHTELFPGARPGLERVIEPAMPPGETEGVTGRVREAGRDGPLRVAFVGAYRRHKGALVFEELLRRGPRPGANPVRWLILGSGDPALLLRARRLGADVLGHYRAGGLVRLLQERRVDLALLLSIWPETFAMTLSECRAAGVPVIAFALGAIADRVAAEGGGLLVPPEEGAAGVAATLERILAGTVEVPRFRGEEAAPSAPRVASERMALYRTLLGESR
jgi:glycosyltransferase involved in cell wall biosynthesis